MSGARPETPSAVPLAALVANVAHDLRGQLHEIMGFEEILRLSSELTESDRRALEHIRHGSEHLRGALYTLIDIARLDCGLYVIEPTPTPVGTIERLARETIPTATVEVRADDTHRLPLLDIGALERALGAHAQIGEEPLSFQIDALGARVRLTFESGGTLTSGDGRELAAALAQRLVPRLGGVALDSGRDGWTIELGDAPAQR
jgi:signal transduction histidine kinase